MLQRGQVRVSVVKKRLTPRDKLAGLTGRGFISCEVLREPPSFLHIGTGGAGIGLAAQADNIDFSGKSFDEALRLARSSPVEVDYSPHVRYGGDPVISGSSIKGMCRARLELLAVQQGGRVSIGFRQSSLLQEIPPPGRHGWRHVRVWMPSTLEDRGPYCCDATESDQVCHACDIFGAPGLSSRVFFSNLVGENVRICRLKLDHNEAVEAIAPGSMFKGWFSFTSLERYELGLVLVGLGARGDGSFGPVLLGKSKYRVREVQASEPRGCASGRIRFGVVKFSLDRLEVCPDGRLESLKVYEGGELRELIRQLVGEASSKVEGLRVGFSELDQLTKLERGELVEEDVRRRG